jgi:hypothetical protein
MIPAGKHTIILKFEFISFIKASFFIWSLLLPLGIGVWKIIRSRITSNNATSEK